MKISRPTFLLAFALLCMGLGLLAPGRAVHSQSAAPVVGVMTVRGPVAPAMQLYIERGLQQAADQGYALVVMQLSTPGGSILTMNLIVERMRASSVPIVVYVSPRGAMAASAGTLLTLAGHAAAMAPETTIGAASPVGSGGEDINTTEALKIKEVLKATARELAQDRKLAAVQLAEEMIDNARAVTSGEALSVGLVDVQTDSVSDLLAQLNGRKVKVLGREQTLQLSGARQENLPPSLVEQALQTFTDPNLVFLFLSAGIWAIIIEISSPGGWVAGFTGAVLLLLATFGLGILPVNWFGLFFLGLAFILFILDIKAPTHGALTVAGGVSFIAGALVLFNSVQVPGIPTISIPLVVSVGLFLAASFFAILMLALKAQAAPVLTGLQTLVGRVGTIREAVSPKGQIQVAGERWTVRMVEGEPGLGIGERAEIVAIEGVQLRVKKAPPQE